ncbi:hypothetical protein F6Y05_34735 [Bacillus megaterium]|nr:hypothetical protein [Priestia megaterium]
MSQTILETEVKKISLLFWERLKLKPSEVWANTELLQQFMLLNPSEMFAIEGYKEKERGGDIEFWVVDRNSKMICLTVQGKRLFEHPSIPDRYDELNYEQLTDLLETADNEKTFLCTTFITHPLKKDTLSLSIPPMAKILDGLIVMLTIFTIIIVVIMANRLLVLRKILAQDTKNVPK